MKTAVATTLIVGGLTAAPLLGNADESPPAEAKPIVEVVASLEKSGYDPLVEVEFDDGYWEVEAYKKDVAYELMVDPDSGEVVSKHRDKPDARPPADGKRLSEIIKRLVKSGYSDVNDLSYEGKSWEVEATRDDVKRELRVDPITAEVISDRADD